MPNIATFVPKHRSTSGRGADLEAKLPRLRRILEEQRQFRLDQLAELAAEEDDAVRHLGVGVVEDVDASADSARAEVTTVIAAAARRALNDIEAALQRMRLGTYGRCVRCGTPIELRRLAALPQAAMCMECQRDTETEPQQRLSGVRW